MGHPAIESLGVYKLEVTNEVFQDQIPMYGDEEQCWAHFSSVVLIEAVVRDLDEQFNVVDFTQPGAKSPFNSPQVAYDEVLLSMYGETLLARAIDCVQNRGHGPLRFAFYLHFYNEILPLCWTYGQTTCPPLCPMPVRLAMMVPYRPCD